MIYHNYLEKKNWFHHIDRQERYCLYQPYPTTLRQKTCCAGWLNLPDTHDASLATTWFHMFEESLQEWHDDIFSPVEILSFSEVVMWGSDKVAKQNTNKPCSDTLVHSRFPVCHPSPGFWRSGIIWGERTGSCATHPIHSTLYKRQTGDQVFKNKKEASLVYHQAGYVRPEVRGIHEYLQGLGSLARILFFIFTTSY